MKKIIYITICMMILSELMAQGFDLIESLPLSYQGRSEARIDGYWLLTEQEPLSKLNGYIVINECTLICGQLETTYSGYNTDNNWQYVKAQIKLSQEWDSTYGHHFLGETGKFVYIDHDGLMKSLSNVQVGGFTNEYTGQTYLTFTHDILGQTQVSFT